MHTRAFDQGCHKGVRWGEETWVRGTGTVEKVTRGPRGGDGPSPSRSLGRREGPDLGSRAGSGRSRHRSQPGAFRPHRARAKPLWARHVPGRQARLVGGQTTRRGRGSPGPLDPSALKAGAEPTSRQGTPNRQTPRQTPTPTGASSPGGRQGPAPPLAPAPPAKPTGDEPLPRHTDSGIVQKKKKSPKPQSWRHLSCHPLSLG